MATCLSGPSWGQGGFVKKGFLGLANNEGREKKSMNSIIDDVNGRIAVPTLLYLMGVPGIIVLLLWAFFFSGR